MPTTRRTFLARVLQCGLSMAWVVHPQRSRAVPAAKWNLRRASESDIPDLVSIFNASREARICPFADLIEPWTNDKAADFLKIYTATIILERSNVPLAFGGLIDYQDPSTTSSIAPDAEPDITVFAVRFDLLRKSEVVPTVKRLAAGLARELQDMGFRSCRMRLSARPMLESEDWFLNHVTVQAVYQREGVEHALDVTFSVPPLLDSLTREGY